MIGKIQGKVLGGENVTFDEAQQLAQFSPVEEVYAMADRIRAHFMGDHFDLCSIVNARSGRCSEDCKWCAQSSHHKTNIDEYELIDREIALQQAMESAGNGVHRFSFVTSGKRISKDNLETLCDLYGEIRSKTDISLCASMGILDRHDLQKLRDVGIVHYHCNLETSRSFFRSLCSTHTWEEKARTIKDAQAVGLKVCSGGIIGMGETMAQRIELAMELRELGVVSIPVNVLMPVMGTSLQDMAPLSDEEILMAIAIFRIVNPKAYIRFAGGRLLFAHIQHKALRAGINAALVGNLLTTVGPDIQQDKKDFVAAGFDISAKVNNT